MLIQSADAEHHLQIAYTQSLPVLPRATITRLLY